MPAEAIQMFVIAAICLGTGGFFLFRVLRKYDKKILDINYNRRESIGDTMDIVEEMGFLNDGYKHYAEVSGKLKTDTMLLDPVNKRYVVYYNVTVTGEIERREQYQGGYYGGNQNRGIAAVRDVAVTAAAIGHLANSVNNIRQSQQNASQSSIPARTNTPQQSVPAPRSNTPAPTPRPNATPSPRPSTPAPSPRPGASAPSPRPSAPSPRPSAPSPRPSAPSPRPSAPSPRPSAPSPRPSAPSPRPSGSSGSRPGPRK